jgi:NADPH:quinone reductase-like Zn-dependent oxidoreductase
MNDWYDEGAVAELCLTVPESIAPKPATLGHVEAAAVPIGALTAWQGLFDRARLQKGERVLAHGGAGSVGAFVVQLAHHHGAHVIATASAKNLARVRELGADEVIDHDEQRFDELVRQVDVVFDTVGGETLERSWKLLAPAGRMISVAAGGEETHDLRQRASFFIVEPNRRQLTSVAALLDARSLQASVNAVVPFAAAASAYAGTVADARGYGKIVIEVAR